MKRLLAALLALVLVACEGVPVRLGSEGPTPAGSDRQLSAQACGFQLLLFIPIVTNNRLERAYRQIRQQALGDYITDVRVTEQWTYALVGTVYCTIVEARVISKT